MKHEINIHNCEAWFLDYHENRLAPEEVLQLLLFLDNHPQFKSAFSHFKNSSIDDLQIDFPNKNLLLKRDAEADLKLSDEEEIVLANIEGKAVQQLANINESELEALRKAKLMAGDEVFENKKSLYHLDITHENIDDWLIAQLEGMLNNDEQNALNNFLANNPQYADEQFLFASAKLHAESIDCDKNPLYKTNIKHDKIDENLIAYTEGILSHNEQKELEIFLAQNPKYKKDLALYQQSKLDAGDVLIYPFKGKLKRKILFPNPILKYVVSGIAACLVIAFGLNLFLNDNNEKLATNKSNGTITIGEKKIEDKIEEQQKNVSASLSNVIDASKTLQEENKNVQPGLSKSKKTSVNKMGTKQNLIPNVAETKFFVDSNTVKLNNFAHLPEEDTTKESIALNPLKIDAAKGPEGDTNKVAPSEIVKGTLVLSTQVVAAKPTTVKEYFANLLNKKGAKTTPDKDLEEYELLSGKRKITDAVAWALTKVSGDRLKVTTMYNADDKLARLKLDRN